MGVLPLVLMLVAEFRVVMEFPYITSRQYLAIGDPVSWTACYMIRVVFAVMPGRVAPQIGRRSRHGNLVRKPRKRRKA